MIDNDIVLYDRWAKEPTPANMAALINVLSSTINSEIYRYTGPKPLLRSKAKALAIGAIKRYDPQQGAKLRSWVVTQLQQLSRYSQQLKPIHVSESAYRRVSELNRIKQELSDELGREPTHVELADKIGISVASINKLQQQSIKAIGESAFDPVDEASYAMPATNESDRMGMADEVVYDSLDERDRQIHEWKTGKGGKAPLSNQEIAKRLGVTPALISQRSLTIANQMKGLLDKGMV